VSMIRSLAGDLAGGRIGHDKLKELGIVIIPASAPDFFTEDTPTAVLVRQVLDAIAQFEKASAVAKLAAARQRKREQLGKCEGRKSHREARPEMVALARKLRRKRPKGGQLSCVPFQRNSPGRASSMSVASHTLPSLWRACCERLD